MAQVKVLLTGASGYIGGSVLQALLNDFGKDISLSALVRSIASRDGVQKIGATPIHFGGLQDIDTIKKTASEHDVVISCASSLDEPSCLALVEGLGIRKQATGQDVFYIHTSGASNFGDHPITQPESKTLKIRTDKDNIYEWERDNSEAWITRKVDVTIIDAGERLDVKTVIVNPPLIYGQGTGPGNQRSIQIPALVGISLHEKEPVVLGKGEGLWSVAHISDVVDFYSLVLRRYIESKPIQFGKRGYYFLENGETSWLGISSRIGEIGYSQRLLKSKEPKQISPEDFTKAINISFLNAYLVEVIWGSNARISAIKSREIGWEPRKSLTDFYNSFEDELKVIAQSGPTQ
ncbi:nadp-binding [Trichoderma arundinaceum]|uniref:Nadp-binding n=1 Tax=Trichoderma arundinaceum TaxID=490622 RepID=A0A395NUF1_TRIAR|nr:nadp-binding [Trichoderma arundinaceum]